jgi:iron only hydrogenase large subunit-like protein
MEGVKEASLTLTEVKPEYSFLEGFEVKVAVAHGTANAKKIMDKVRSGEANYHFVEIMGCPGGCIGGGGQPIPTSAEIRAKRAQAIYEEDSSKQMRMSHENPEIDMIYKEFLGEPCGEVSHHLLHTHYTPRARYLEK